MEPGLKVPLLYTAASLLSSSSSIVFIFSASPELRRRRFASPATPDAAFLTGGHPEAHPPHRSSLDAAPITEEPLAAPDAAPSSSPEGIVPTPPTPCLPRDILLLVSSIVFPVVAQSRRSVSRRRGRHG